MSILYLDFKKKVDASEGIGGGITLISAQAYISELQEKGTIVSKPIQEVSLEYLVSDGSFIFNLINEFGCASRDAEGHPLEEFGKNTLGGTMNASYQHSLSLIPDEEHADQKCSIQEYVEYVCDKIATNMEIQPENLLISVRNAWTHDNFKGEITYNSEEQNWKSVTLHSTPAPAQP